MIEPSPSFLSQRTDNVPVLVLHKTHHHVGHKPSKTIEDVLANHTALKPKRHLCVSYTIQSLRTGLPLLAVDLLVTCVCLLVASWAVNVSQGHAFSPRIWNQIPAVLLLQWVLFSLHQLYPGAGISAVSELRGIVRSTCVGFFCLSAINIIFGQLPRIEFVTFTIAAISAAILLPLLRDATRRMLSKTSWWGIRMLLIGSRDECRKQFRDLSTKRASGFIPVGYTSGLSSADTQAMNDPAILGTHDDAVIVACQHSAPVVGLVSTEQRTQWTDRLLFQFPSVAWLGHADSTDGEIDTSSLPEVCVTHVNMPFLRTVPRFVKRGTDLLVVVPALFVLAIPMLVLALIIKVVAPGPVFYASPRIGQHGKPFRMWKFRSMVVDAETRLAAIASQSERDGTCFKMRRDPRITRVGAILRRLSLDELPQLFNIATGDMSVVGPRPALPREVLTYSSKQRARLIGRPGLTCTWQVSGKAEIPFERQVLLDIDYLRNRSFLKDMALILKTVPAVLTARGAY